MKMERQSGSAAKGRWKNPICLILIILFVLLLIGEGNQAWAFGIKKTKKAPALNVQLSQGRIFIPGQATLNLSGGTPPYSIQETGSQIVTVQKTGDGVFTITGNAPGRVMITVQDSGGQTRAVSVEVAHPPFTATIKNALLAIGKQTEVKLSGGKPPYRMLPDSQWGIIIVRKMIPDMALVEGKATGSTIMNFEDASGQKATVNITVPPRLYVGVPPWGGFNTSLGRSAEVLIKDGARPYKYSDPSGLTTFAGPSRNNSDLYAIYGAKAGKTNVAIEDSAGQAVKFYVSVQVPYWPPTVRCTPDKKQFSLRENVNCNIYQGLPPYRVSESGSGKANVKMTGADTFAFSPTRKGYVYISIADTKSSASWKIDVK
jgi:hypothetical protein